MLATISIFLFIIYNLVVNETVDSRFAVVIVLIGTVFKVIDISNISISPKLFRRKLQLFLKGHRSFILGKDLRRVEIEYLLNGTSSVSEGAFVCDLKLSKGNGCYFLPLVQ